MIKLPFLSIFLIIELCSEPRTAAAHLLRRKIDEQDLQQLTQQVFSTRCSLKCRLHTAKCYSVIQQKQINKI